MPESSRSIEGQPQPTRETSIASPEFSQTRDSLTGPTVPNHPQPAKERLASQQGTHDGPASPDHGGYDWDDYLPLFEGSSIVLDLRRFSSLQGLDEGILVSD